MKVNLSMQSFITIIFLTLFFIVLIAAIESSSSSNYFNRVYTIEDVKHLKYGLYLAGEDETIFYTYRNVQDNTLGLIFEDYKISVFEATRFRFNEYEEGIVKDVLQNTHLVSTPVINNEKFTNKYHEQPPLFDVKGNQILDVKTPNFNMIITDDKFYIESSNLDK